MFPAASHRPRLPAVLAMVALAWWGALAAAPACRAAGGAWGVAAAVFHGACGRLCHQRPDRSFGDGGGQWPVCARCAGLYAGAAIGAGAAWLAVRRWWRRGHRVPPPTTWRVPVIVAAAPTGLSWALEMTGVTGFTNLSRFAAAVPLGALAAWAVSAALAREAAGGLH